MQTDRLANLQKIKDLGYNPYLENNQKLNSGIFDLLQSSTFLLDKDARINGRITSKRVMGNMAFLNLSFSSVPFDKICSIQLVFKTGLSREGWKDFVKALDIGDIVYVEGKTGLTQTEERSIFVEDFTILTKSLEPIPFGKQTEDASYNTVSDEETLLRHRHLALLTNSDLREKLVNKSRLISLIRRFLSFTMIEVQTPILLQNPGGAEAKTFDTVYNAHNTEVKLRISLEIQLKKLLCGGFNNIFEIGTVFRNEGVSSKHNPEFTLLEYYDSYFDFQQGIEKFQNLMSKLGYFLKNKSFSNPKIITMKEAFSTFAEVDLDELLKEPDAIELIDSILKEKVEPNFTGFWILTEHPAIISPLARCKNYPYSERFEAYFDGVEIANGFCEQNDPQLQLEVLKKQSEDLGTPLDNEFIYALSCGMPPAFGVGIGIERLAMAIFGASHIKEVSWFPFVKNSE